MTVLDVIQRSAEYLARKGVDSPRLQIELLLAQVLSLPRLQLYLSFERQLTEAELGTVRELVRRRGTREPLQHLLGTVSFCGLEFTVNPHVLIPRPETELLAEHAWLHLSALKSSVKQPRVLDLGTGSGCLAVTLAVKSPPPRFAAIDISPAALALARRNAARHGVQERIEFYCGDAFAPLPPGMQFDLMVANPPYIPTMEIANLQPEVRDHDPRAALDGGSDGLDLIRVLAVQAPAFLQPGARLMMEFGDGQQDRVSTLFSSPPWTVVELVNDDTERPRILVAEHG